jgi:hypothetical protein
MATSLPIRLPRAEYLARAEEFRMMAASATDATLLHSYTSLAASYELLARFAERDERHAGLDRS